VIAGGWKEKGESYPDGGDVGRSPSYPPGPSSLPLPYPSSGRATTPGPPEKGGLGAK
jgi:hypothetical protein